ncbi:MAG: LCP family protein [Clostridiales Family XIII bacterium]|jgi:LCP family protein required for cell wall assembly|nr:LCP family protein [Clostridiales Family XIII bacterium]
MEVNTNIGAAVKKKKTNTVLKIFIIVFLVVLLGSVVLFFALNNSNGVGKGVINPKKVLEEINMNPFVGANGAIAQEFPDSKRVNMLLLGTSSLDLTDTMMLGSFDTELKRVDIVSVPRDTYVDRTEYKDPALKKINSTYQTYDKDKYKDGFESVCTEVSNVLGGVPIHFYALISDDGVAHIIDAMGGVEIDVPIQMDYEDAGQDLFIHLQKGLQTLNGDQSIQFLRFRKGYANGDLGRVEAQQNFMKEAFKQSIGFGFPKVVSTGLAEVQTNMNAAQGSSLATSGLGMGTSDLHTVVIPGVPETINGASYFIADAEATAVAMRDLYSMTKETADATENADGETDGNEIAE